MPVSATLHISSTARRRTAVVVLAGWLVGAWSGWSWVPQAIGGWSQVLLRVCERGSGLPMPFFLLSLPFLLWSLSGVLLAGVSQPGSSESSTPLRGFPPAVEFSPYHLPRLAVRASSGIHLLGLVFPFPSAPFGLLLASYLPGPSSALPSALPPPGQPLLQPRSLAESSFCAPAWLGLVT